MSGPATTTPDSATTQAQNINIRTALSDAYSAVESYKTVQTFNAITFEELLDQQITRITGPDTDSRPSELTRVQSVLSNLQQAVTQIKAMPADAFSNANAARDVNTPA
jgi:hypothetical protein